MDKDIVHALEIQADADSIYQALTTQGGLASFWTADCDAEPKEATVARFGFPGAPVDCRMRVEQLRPGKKVSWVCEEFGPGWAGTTVSWELGPGPQGGVGVMFHHAGWADDYPVDQMAGFNFVWGQVLGRLKAYVESGKPQPFFP